MFVFRFDQLLFSELELAVLSSGQAAELRADKKKLFQAVRNLKYSACFNYTVDF